MTDMINAFTNGTSLEAFESNGYVVLKAENRTDLIYVIDPETGIVRDINTVGGFCGAYCYYDLQTNLAETLGNLLINGQNRIPADKKLRETVEDVNRFSHKPPQEYRTDTTGDEPPSKLDWAKVLVVGSLAFVGYSVAKEIYYNNVTSSDYNDNNNVLVLNNISVSTNQSIIEITEIRKSGT